MKKEIIYKAYLLSIFIFLSSCAFLNNERVSIKKQYATSKILPLEEKIPLVKSNDDTLFFKNSVLLLSYEDDSFKPTSNNYFIWPSLFSSGGNIHESVKIKSYDKMTTNEKLLYESTRIDSLMVNIEYISILSSRNKKVLKLYVRTPNTYHFRIYYATYKAINKQKLKLNEISKKGELIEFRFSGIEL